MNLGYEPKVVGYSFFDGFKTNATSPAIKGQDGVFYISLKERFRKENGTIDPMMQQQVYMQNMQMRNAIASMLQESMKRKADIEYNVKNLY